MAARTRRPLLAMLGAALALALAPSAAPAAAPAPASTSPALGPRLGEMAYGGLVALELPPTGWDDGVRVTAEGTYGFLDVAPQARLSLGGRAALAYHGASGFAHVDNLLFLAELVPQAKLAFAVVPGFAVYGDVGLGLALVHRDYLVPAIPTAPASGSDTNLALTFQVGAGASYALTANLNLLGEVRFDFYTTSGAGTFASFPSLGLQWHG